MPLCKKITFENKNGTNNAGHLTILNELGAFLYDDTIIGKTVYLKFGDPIEIDDPNQNEEEEIKKIPCRHLTVTTSSTASFHIARYPFKYSTEGGATLMFPSITFGTLQNAEELVLDKIEGGDGSPHKVKIGAMGSFSMGFSTTDTIGTDDMRNGKVNNTVFNIENKAISLEILYVGGDHFLELGYEKEV